MPIFDTASLTELQRAYFNRVLDSYDFDWDSMLPLLKKRSAMYGPTLTRIPVVVKDISAWGAAGLPWPDGRGLEIDDQVAPDAAGPESWLWFMQVLIHELGHHAHFFGLNTAQESRVPAILGRDGFIGCQFGNPFPRAFSYYLVGRTSDANVGPSAIRQLRRLMGGKGPAPEKVEMVA